MSTIQIYMLDLWMLICIVNGNPRGDYLFEASSLGMFSLREQDGGKSSPDDSSPMTLWEGDQGSTSCPADSPTPTILLICLLLLDNCLNILGYHRSQLCSCLYHSFF